MQKIQERFTRKVRSGGIRFLDRVPVLKGSNVKQVQGTSFQMQDCGGFAFC